MQNIVFDYFENDDKFIIVCEKDGEIVGFSCLEIVKKPDSPYCFSREFLRVVEIGTDENHRRQGIGSEIFDFIKNFAKEKGFNKIELDMWEFNESALKFYESMGFKTYRRYMDFEF